MNLLNNTQQPELAARYLNERKQKGIEEISVYEIPRCFVPNHIMEMALLALEGKIADHGAFFDQASQ